MTTYDEDEDGGKPLFDNSHISGVGVFGLSQDLAGEFPDSIFWTLSCSAKQALAGATSLTFRVGVKLDTLNEATCTPVDIEFPGIRIVMETTEGDFVNVDANGFAEFALPDTRVEDSGNCSNVAPGLGCRSWDAMQATVRVPLREFCQAGLTLDRVERIGLTFSSPNPVDGLGTLLAIDDLEIRRVPGEPIVSCRCDG